MSKVTQRKVATAVVSVIILAIVGVMTFWLGYQTGQTNQSQHGKRLAEIQAAQTQLAEEKAAEEKRLAEEAVNKVTAAVVPQRKPKAPSDPIPADWNTLRRRAS